MVKVVLISKTGSLTNSSLQRFDIKMLYKKCKFANNNNFKKQTTWKTDDGSYVSLFAKTHGRANSENKYDLPPPVDEQLFFGLMLLCAHTESELTNDNVKDFNKTAWTTIYNKLFGGFEDLGSEDSEEEPEEEIDPKYLTPEGYSTQDGFVVNDDELEQYSTPDEESEYVDSDTSGLSEEDYLS